MNARLDSSNLTVAFIQAQWHSDIVDRAREGFAETLPADVKAEYFTVPGAFELPLQVRALAATGRFDAVVAAGFVVDGGIYRHEFVADAVISGLMRVQLDANLPVFSCVLTPQHFHESQDHLDFFRNHMHGKGVEVATTCFETLLARTRVAELV